MKREVKCPGCGVRLRYGADLEDQPGICPACEQLVLPPNDDADDDEPDGDDDPHAITDKPGKTKVLQKVLPIDDDRLNDVEREGRSLARENRIDLDEQLEKEFDNKAHADD